MGLTDIIVSKINKSGPVSFKEYMNMALYHHEYGYYRQTSFPAGGRGDFVTSPHTSRLFGAVLANQLAEFCKRIPEAAAHGSFTIVEMGAGAGYLAADLISAIQEFHSSVIKGFRYIIVEPFLETRSIQKKTLGSLASNVKWVDHLNQVGRVSGCVISNELIDAFPVNVVQKRDSKWYELFVGYCEEEGFIEILQSLEDEFLKQYVKTLPADLPSPYRTEVRGSVREWIQNVSQVLNAGFILTIDYGYTYHEYFAPFRNRGTVMGYHSQQALDNVLQHPGLIDITAHVNFSDVAQWGEEFGFTVCGYTPQYAFLAGLDFEETFKRIYGEINPFSPEMAAVKMLIMPQGMGESHKVLVQSKGIEGELKLSGFSFADHSSSLLVKS